MLNSQVIRKSGRRWIPSGWGPGGASRTFPNPRSSSIPPMELSHPRQPPPEYPGGERPERGLCRPGHAGPVHRDGHLRRGGHRPRGDELLPGLPGSHRRHGGDPRPASAFDGLVTISSCDKAVPGHLMALARLDLPGLHVSGGSMAPGPRFISADTCYETNLRVAEGNMTAEEEWYYKRNACMSCGACQYMGTASTMQAMAEALGMSLPGNAMIPANTSLITHLAADAGAQAAELIRRTCGPAPS